VCAEGSMLVFVLREGPLLSRWSIEGRRGIISGRRFNGAAKEGGPRRLRDIRSIMRRGVNSLGGFAVQGAECRLSFLLYDSVTLCFGWTL